MDPFDASDLVGGFLPDWSPWRLIVSTFASLVVGWLVSRYLRENAPDLGGGSRWTVSGTLSLVAGYVADWFAAAIAAHLFLSAIALLAVAAFAGTFAVGMAWPSARAAWIRRRTRGMPPARKSGRRTVTGAARSRPTGPGPRPRDARREPAKE